MKGWKKWNDALAILVSTDSPERQLRPELFCGIFQYFWNLNYIHFLPLAWTLHLCTVYDFWGWNTSSSSSPPPLCPVSLPHPSPSPLCRHNAVLLSFSLPRPQACTRAADKDTNTNWQPLGQARMIETVSVAGRRNSRKRTNTVLLLPT